MSSLGTFEDSRIAFNAGADARLAGAPLAENPHQRALSREQHEMWDLGWRDVDTWWGKLSRWPHKKLPPVRASAQGA
jgi:hypothetical protein